MGRTSHHPRAGAAQRRVGRHRLAGAQRLRGRAPRDARARSCGSPTSSTTRPPPRRAASVTQRSHVIGVFMETGEGHPDLQHPFFHEVLGGLKQRVGAQRLRPAAVRVRASRQRLRPALLPQARPPPQRRRRRADRASTPRTPRCAGSVARGDPVRRHRHGARGPGDRGRHVRQRGRRSPAVRHLHEPRAPPDRDDHRHARVAPGRRPPARLPRGAAGARARLPRRVRRLRRLLRRDRPPSDGRICCPSTSRRRRSSPPRT